MSDFTHYEYTFKNPALLQNALTHSSYANENRDKGVRNNERLEFLGDSVLGLICAKHIYSEYRSLPEGELTKLRAAIVPITNIGSKLAMPLILIGVLLSFLGNFSYTLVDLGIACFSLSLVFQLITLPVEFNASRRAMAAIEDGNILSAEEQRGAKKPLKAAAMTYVAATAVALAQLLRLILLFGGRRRSD